MREGHRLEHRFVDFIPEQPEQGVVYVSMEYCTVLHRCFCGCGREVVTPLSPAQWKLVFDGETVSLDPSIGNWSYECESHYWIRRNRVVWAPSWSREEIVWGRAQDREDLKRHFRADEGMSGRDVVEVGDRGEGHPAGWRERFWKTILWWR